MTGAFDAAADELYGVPLDDFVPRRDALSRAARVEGDRASADAIRRLTKPSAPAWTINRLVRERPDELAELMRAGEELRRTQEWLLRGEADPGDLRAAVESERAVVSRLVHAGADVLAAAGRAVRGDVLERIGETLHATATDPVLRAEVEAGRLVRDRSAVGLGPEATAAAAPSPARAPRRAPGSRRAAQPARPPARSERDDAAEAREAAAQAREALANAEAEARAAASVSEQAAQAVARAERGLETAEESYERARDAVRDARAELGAAQKASRAAKQAAGAAEERAAARRRDETS